MRAASSFQNPNQLQQKKEKKQTSKKTWENSGWDCMHICKALLQLLAVEAERSEGGVCDVAAAGYTHHL